MDDLYLILGLHEKLVEKHGPRGRIIPPAPEKNLVGTTRVKISNNSSTTSFDGTPHPNDTEIVTSNSELHRSTEKEFITRRRIALERFVNRVGQHPVLRKGIYLVYA